MADEQKAKAKGIDINSVLGGNYQVAPATVGGLAQPQSEGRDLTEELEQKARARIGGSIAFVTRLKDEKKDPLFFSEDEA